MYWIIVIKVDSVDNGLSSKPKYRHFEKNDEDFVLCEYFHHLNS
jgi:hypothetical protein